MTKKQLQNIVLQYEVIVCYESGPEMLVAAFQGKGDAIAYGSSLTKRPAFQRGLGIFIRVRDLVNDGILYSNYYSPGSAGISGAVTSKKGE